MNIREATTQKLRTHQSIKTSFDVPNKARQEQRGRTPSCRIPLPMLQYPAGKGDGPAPRDRSRIALGAIYSRASLHHQSPTDMMRSPDLVKDEPMVCMNRQQQRRTIQIATRPSPMQYVLFNTYGVGDLSTLDSPMLKNEIHAYMCAVLLAHLTQASYFPLKMGKILTYISTALQPSAD